MKATPDYLNELSRRLERSENIDADLAAARFCGEPLCAEDQLSVKLVVEHLKASKNDWRFHAAAILLEQIGVNLNIPVENQPFEKLLEGLDVVKRVELKLFASQYLPKKRRYEDVRASAKKTCPSTGKSVGQHRCMCCKTF